MIRFAEHQMKIADARKQLKKAKTNTPHFRDALKHYNRLVKQYKTAISYTRGKDEQT